MFDSAGNYESRTHELTDLRASVMRLRSRQQQGETAAWCGDELIQLRQIIDLMEVTFATCAAEFAADESNWEGSTSPVCWIRYACHTSAKAAADAVSVGMNLTQLPKSAEAMEEGKIGFAHLALIARTSEAIRQSATAGEFVEGPLLQQAQNHTVTQFRRDCAHARHAADAQAFLAEHINDVGWRRLELLPNEDGALMIRGFFDPVAGATLRTALEPLAKRSGIEDDRSRERRLADALVELAHHGLDEGVVPQRAGQRPHLQVTTTLETLMGLTGASAGELDFAGPIPAAVVQRLACDASIVRVLLGSDSAVLDVGRARRQPSVGMRRALNVRDAGCVWPGCDRPPSWTSPHHIHHWSLLGPTRLPNLALLCYRHHWMVHEGGWQVVRTESEGVQVIPRVPSAHSWARAPDIAVA